MQDFTGVPAIVDLAAMWDATIAAGRKTADINPSCDVDLIDHSVSVDSYGHPTALTEVLIEMKRNKGDTNFSNGGKSIQSFRGSLKWDLSSSKP